MPWDHLLYYRCDIPTDAIHDDNDLSVRETVYVGLYASGGNEYNCIQLGHSHSPKMLSILLVLNLMGATR